MGNSKSSTAKKVSSPQDFKKKKNAGVMLDLPSGLRVKAKRVRISAFISSGNDIPNPLMPLIAEALQKGGDIPMDKLVDPEKGVDVGMVSSMFELMDSIAMRAVMEPTLSPAPVREEDRMDDMLYVDELDEEDRMFIFQWVVGGTDDVAQFREEAEKDLVALAEGEDTPSSSQ